MLDLEIAINGLLKIDLALESAMRATEDGDLTRADYALDSIKLSLDDCRKQLNDALREARKTI